MTKKDIVKEVASRFDELSQRKVGEVFDTILDVIMDAMVSGDKVALSGFGTFEVKDRPARQCRNPQTGETMMTKPSKAPKFKAMKALKDSVNA